MKLVVRTNTSTTSELTAKKQESSSILKYTEPWRAPAAWKNFGSTAMAISAAPSRTSMVGR